MSSIAINKKSVDAMLSTPAISQDALVDSVLIESSVVLESAGLFDLLALAAQEAENKPTSKVVKGQVQTRNPLNQPYIHNNAVPVPFKVSLCMSIAEHLMHMQGVDFIPLAIVLAVAKELHFDLRMQGRSAASQVKTQAKDLHLGIFAEQSFKVGTQEGKLVGLKVAPSKLEALRGCRYSLLPANV